MKQKRFIILLSILGVLIVIALVSTLTEDKKAAGNFSSELVQFDAEEVTQVQVYPPEENAFRIEKGEEDTWMLQVDGNRYNAEKMSMDQLFQEMSGMKALQVVSRNKDAWGDFSVGDSAGVRVQVTGGDKTLADVYVGRMDFGQPRNQNQRQPETFTFVRPNNSEEVYKVRGMLSMFLREGQRAFRSTAITRCQEAAVARMDYTYPADSSFSLVKNDSLWFVDGMKTDSASFETYMDGIENFSSRSFAEEGVAAPSGEAPYRLSVSGPAMETINVEGWNWNAGQFLVMSSINPGTVFSLSESQFTRLFRGKSYFFGAAEN